MKKAAKNSTGRPKTFDTEEVLLKARDIFWKKGYCATSTDDLLIAMAIGRSSFYLEFPGGKMEVFRRTVDLHARKSYNRLKKSLDESPRPLEVLKDFFRAMGHSTVPVHQKGCFSGNAIVEMSQIEPEMEQAAVATLKELEALFAKTLIAARAGGALKHIPDPALLARHLITLWNGLNITRRMYSSNAQLLPLIEMQLSVLD